MAALASRSIAVGELLQHASRVQYRGSPLHFGTAAAHRHDVPDKSYGVLYAAMDLATALMESVFHQPAWHTSPRRITMTEVRQRLVRVLEVRQPLALFDRARAKLGAPVHIELVRRRDWPEFVATYRIAVAEDAGGPTPSKQGPRRGPVA